MNKTNNHLFTFRKNLPPKLKRLIFRLQYLGFKHYCNVCHSNIRRFYPGGLKQPVLHELEIVGSGYHEYDYCPVCKASYRQRLVNLYFDEFKILKPNLKVLHIAPEESLYHILRKNNKKGYICGDLMPERYSYYAKPIFLDLTKLNFADNSFDLVVCNHVLEHIPDDHKALSEIYRVLVKGGIAILQVPISEKLNSTYEDPSIQSEKERLEKFGQRDHVRIYAKDYGDRLKRAGFQVDIFSYNAFSHAKHFNKLMLDEKEKLFIATKLN